MLKKILKRSSMQNFIKIFFNASIFYIGWFSCVIGAARGEALLGPVIVLGLLGLHLVLVKEKIREIVLIVTLTLFGFLLDSAYIQFGLLKYVAENQMFKNFAPLWIVSIWALFATSLNYAMSPLKDKIILSAVLGAWGGIVSYLAGYKLGAVEFFLPLNYTLFIIGSIWAMVVPLTLYYAKWVNKKLPVLK